MKEPSSVAGAAFAAEPAQPFRLAAGCACWRKAVKPFLIFAVVLAFGRTALPAYGFTYTFTTIAGNPAILYSYADGSNSSALFNGPSGIAVDSLGDLYVADQLNYVIRQARHVDTN